MSTDSFQIVEHQGFWHVAFAYCDAESSTVQKHFENTGYKVNGYPKSKAKREAKKIFNRITTPKATVPEPTICIPMALVQDEKYPIVIKERHTKWHMYFRYEDNSGNIKVCRRSTGLPATTDNHLMAFQIAKATRQVLSADPNPRIGHTQKNGILFSQLIHEHMDTVKGRGRTASTVKSYNSILNTHLRPTFGEHIVSDITTKEVERWFSLLTDKHNKPLSPKTKNNILNFFSEIMNTAERWEYIKENPIKKISRCTLPENPQTFWSIDERNLFLDVVEKEAPELHTLFTTFLYTGMRFGEMIALRWKHINFDRNTILIQDNYVEGTLKLPKGGKTRQIQACEHLMKSLRRHYKQSANKHGLVFPTAEGTYTTNSRIRAAFKRLIDKAGVTHIRIHDMRHTFASLALMSGVDVPTVQQWLGHKNIQTTMKYIQLLPEHMQKQAVKLNPTTNQANNMPSFTDNAA